MKFNRYCLMIAPMCIIAASPACSQPVPGGSGKGTTLDTFLNRQTGRIMAADTDGDGRISRAEMAAMAGQKSGGGRDPARLFDAMDTNHDGYLDKDEIKAALTRRFMRMDKNGDGVITPDERMGGRKQRGQDNAMPPAAQPTSATQP